MVEHNCQHLSAQHMMMTTGIFIPKDNETFSMTTGPVWSLLNLTLERIAITVCSIAILGLSSCVHRDVFPANYWLLMLRVFKFSV